MASSKEDANSEQIQAARLEYHHLAWKRYFLAADDPRASSAFHTLLELLESSREHLRDIRERMASEIETLLVECFSSGQKADRGLWLLEECIVPFTRLMPGQDLTVLERELRAKLVGRDEGDRDHILATILPVINKQSPSLWARRVVLHLRRNARCH